MTSRCIRPGRSINRRDERCGQSGPATCDDGGPSVGGPTVWCCGASVAATSDDSGVTRCDERRHSWESGTSPSPSPWVSDASWWPGSFGFASGPVSVASSLVSPSEPSWASGTSPSPSDFSWWDVTLCCGADPLSAFAVTTPPMPRAPTAAAATMTAVLRLMFTGSPFWLSKWTATPSVAAAVADLRRPESALSSARAAADEQEGCWP
jgi:hypothetical protein